MANLQDSYILTVLDRPVFHCSVETIESELHWVFVTAAHARYVGPRWMRVLNELELRALLNDWWQSASDLPHSPGDRARADAVEG